MPERSSGVGFMRMEAKPPLFSRESSPLKIKVPCSVREKPPLEIPPMTPSFTDVQASRQSSDSKVASVFSSAMIGNGMINMLTAAATRPPKK